MHTDANTYMSDGQAITASAASTEYIDVQNAGLGIDGPWVVVRTTEAFATLTSLTVAVETDSATNFGTKRILFSSGAIATANLTINKELVKFQLPHDCRRYIRIYYTVAGTNASAGKVTAFVAADVNQGQVS
jgi:hypothetical protein